MPPPRGGGALLRNLSDNSAHSEASLSGQNTTQNGATNLTPQEQLLAGTLELDPENDPVIYTTDYGLDIRWHMAGLPANPNDIAIMPGGQKFETYAYFNHGGVNWVIIGRSNKSIIFSGVANLSNILEYYKNQNVDYYNFSNTTSGIWQYFLNSINDELEDQINEIHSSYHPKIYVTSTNITTITQKDVFPNAKPTGELEINEVLCFAQNSFSTESKFYDSQGAGNCYYNSRLMTTMNAFYDSNLTDLPIVEKTLQTVWYGASDTTNGSYLPGTYKIFPLAGANANESFYVFNYLTSGSDPIKQSAAWWLRSGTSSSSYYPYYISANGILYKNDVVNYTNGVRPAFVLKIT